jgi:predicted acyltransferase
MQVSAAAARICVRLVCIVFPPYLLTSGQRVQFAVQTKSAADRIVWRVTMKIAAALVQNNLIIAFVLSEVTKK